MPAAARARGREGARARGREGARARGREGARCEGARCEGARCEARGARRQPRGASARAARPFRIANRRSNSTFNLRSGRRLASKFQVLSRLFRLAERKTKVEYNVQFEFGGRDVWRCGFVAAGRRCGVRASSVASAHGVGGAVGFAGTAIRVVRGVGCPRADAVGGCRHCPRPKNMTSGRDGRDAMGAMRGARCEGRDAMGAAVIRCWGI